MPISADQCRAGRGLINWTQDKLAINARVSRATVAEFENNSRIPQTNNLRSIEDCMFAAGVEFIAEQDKLGVGVRFRERKLEYTNNVRVDRFNDRATMKMRYAGEDFLCQIDLDVINDYHRENFDTDEEFTTAIGEILHVILARVEPCASTQIQNGLLVVTSEMLKQDSANR
jgi:transcriptional regulator with XRE-family HTH domain